MNARVRTEPHEADIESVLVSAEAIRERVAEMGAQIAAELAHAEGGVVLVPVMTGSIVFVADLMRAMPLRMRIGITAVSSYPGRATQGEALRAMVPVPQGLGGRHVLLVDDILDTGRTLRHLRAEIGRQGPAWLKTCVLVRKTKESALATPCEHVGFDIPDEFVVGYGLDYDNEYRNLPYIGTLRPEARR